MIAQLNLAMFFDNVVDFQVAYLVTKFKMRLIVFGLTLVCPSQVVNLILMTSIILFINVGASDMITGELLP